MSEKISNSFKKLNIRFSLYKILYLIFFRIHFFSPMFQFFKKQFQAIPCLLLLTFTIALIHRLRENNEKRKILIKEERAKKRGDFTTYMLLLMVTVFLFTELPQGIMAILNGENFVKAWAQREKLKASALFTTQFHQMVYLNLADVLDLLSLINCYVAFLVYSFTSSRYRQTLFSLLPLTK